MGRIAGYLSSPARHVCRTGRRRVHESPYTQWQLCLFRANPQGTRAGKVVVAQHRSIEDPELGGSFTVKVYSSEKKQTNDGSWTHTRVDLLPDSTDSSFVPLVFGPEAADSVKIVAEMIAVLDA